MVAMRNCRTYAGGFTAPVPAAGGFRLGGAGVSTNSFSSCEACESSESSVCAALGRFGGVVGPGVSFASRAMRCRHPATVVVPSWCRGSGYRSLDRGKSYAFHKLRHRARRGPWRLGMARCWRCQRKSAKSAIYVDGQPVRLRLVLRDRGGVSERGRACKHVGGARRSAANRDDMGLPCPPCHDVWSSVVRRGSMW